jgi:hypothetical protein
LCATLLYMVYAARSDRLLIEEFDYHMLFRWFVGLNLDDAARDATVFTKNRDCTPAIVSLGHAETLPFGRSAARTIMPQTLKTPEGFEPSQKFLARRDFSAACSASGWQSAVKAVGRPLR